MRNITNYNAEKYKSTNYIKIEENIYKINNEFVTSLSFEQDFEQAKTNSLKNILQYPLEDILDKFYVYISDFYKELNKNNSNICFLEFASDNIQNIKNLRSIINKHVYNKIKIIDGIKYKELMIE